MKIDVTSPGMLIAFASLGGALAGLAFGLVEVISHKNK